MYERAVLTTPTWSREVKVDIAMFCEQLTDDFLEIEALMNTYETTGLLTVCLQNGILTLEKPNE